MTTPSILTDEFCEAAARAGQDARRRALESGHSVISVDSSGRYVEELSDGRRFEVRFDHDRPRQSHRVIVRELRFDAA